jgi:sulfide:quinone oxidoreductase
MAVSSESAQVVILGGGTGGTLVANRLRRALEPSVAITVVDQDDRHVYQPGLLFVPFGRRGVDAITRSRRRQLAAGIDFVQARISHIDLAGRAVYLSGPAPALRYDVLVVATGAVLAPQETYGLAEAERSGMVHNFYSPAGATALADALSRFDNGRLLVNVVDLPIKCPVAPLEFCFLADGFFRHRGVRDKVELAYATPLDAAFTKPVAAKALAGLLDDKGVEMVTEFNTAFVDGDRRVLGSYDGRELGFDLAVVIPLHAGASYVARSPGLGDPLGFVTVDERTLQSTLDARVFAIGDAAALPASKAGSVAHFEGEIVTENVRRFLADQPLTASFDGHTNCFVETGSDKALLIDFNYDTEPLPGRYPGRLGLPLLRESRLDHLGKLAFEPLYWHALLPGRELIGVRSAMPVRGKRFPSAEPPAMTGVSSGKE